MKRVLLAAALVVTTPAFAQSQDSGLNYNHVEAGYSATNAKRYSPDDEGWTINASAAIAPSFHIFGGYQRLDKQIPRFDNGSIDAKQDQMRFGIGYNTAATSSTDLVARLAYERERYTSNFSGFDDPTFNRRLRTSAHGYSAEVGARSAFTPNWQGYAFAGYRDLNDNRLDSRFYGRLGSNYAFNRNWSLTGEVKVAERSQQWFIGPRFSW